MTTQCTGREHISFLPSSSSCPSLSHLFLQHKQQSSRINITIPLFYSPQSNSLSDAVSLPSSQRRRGRDRGSAGGGEGALGRGRGCSARRGGGGAGEVWRRQGHGHSEWIEWHKEAVIDFHFAAASAARQAVPVAMVRTLLCAIPCRCPALFYISLRRRGGSTVRYTAITW